MRSGLFDRPSLGESFERLLAGYQAVCRAWHTPGGQHSQRAATNPAKAAANQNPIMPAVVCLSAPPSVADDCDLAARRAPPGQPFRVVLVGLASIAGTWDKDDHGCEGIAPESLPAKAHDSAAPPSLLSIRVYAEKESHPALFEIGRFNVHNKNKNIFGFFSASYRHRHREPEFPHARK